MKWFGQLSRALPLAEKRHVLFSVNDMTHLPDAALRVVARLRQLGTPLFVTSAPEPERRCGIAFVPESLFMQTCAFRRKEDQTFPRPTIDRAVWRGVPSDPSFHCGVHNFNQQRMLDSRGLSMGCGDGSAFRVQRMQLSFLSKARPDLLDAGLASVQYQFGSKAAQDAAGRAGLHSPGLTMAEMHRYKAVVHVDGLGSSNGFLRKLMSNRSVILKVDSSPAAGGGNLWEWWYDRVQPNVHFVSVSHDLNDALEKIDLVLHRNKTFFRLMALRARHAALQITYRASVEYGLRVLLASSFTAGSPCGFAVDNNVSLPQSFRISGPCATGDWVAPP